MRRERTWIVVGVPVSLLLVGLWVVAGARAGGLSDFTLDSASPEVPGTFAAGDIIPRTGSPPASVFATQLGVGADEIDAFSFGKDQLRPLGPGAFVALEYSVSRSTLGTPGSVIAIQRAGNGAAGDKYVVKMRNFLNTLFPIVGPYLSSDAPSHNLTPLPGTQSNIDGHGLPSGTNMPVIFSLAPGNSLGRDPAELLIVREPGVTAIETYATRTQLGLQAGDNIDAVLVKDVDLSGPTFGFDDFVDVSLDVSSPTRDTLFGAGGGDGLIRVVPGPVAVSVTPGVLALEDANSAELDAAAAFDPVVHLPNGCALALTPFGFFQFFPNAIVQDSGLAGQALQVEPYTGAPWSPYYAQRLPDELGGKIVGSVLPVGEDGCPGRSSLDYVVVAPGDTLPNGNGKIVGDLFEVAALDGMKVLGIGTTPEFEDFAMCVAVGLTQTRTIVTQFGDPVPGVPGETIEFFVGGSGFGWDGRTVVNLDLFSNLSSHPYGIIYDGDQAGFNSSEPWNLSSDLFLGRPDAGTGAIYGLAHLVVRGDLSVPPFTTNLYALDIEKILPGGSPRATTQSVLREIVPFGAPVPPDDQTTFVDFGLSPVVDGGLVAFQGSGADLRTGIYVYRFSDDGIFMIADTNTPVPDGVGNFTSFANQTPVSLSNGRVAFVGDSGIYLSSDPISATGTAASMHNGGAGGELLKIVASGDVLDDRTVTGVDMSKDALSGESLTFIAAFSSDLTRTVYAFQLIADTDGDGIPDGGGAGPCATGETENCFDNCPFEPNNGPALARAHDGSVQTDTDGNGRGDACECGNADGNTILNIFDALHIAQGTLTPPLVTMIHPRACDADGNGTCDIFDALRVAQATLTPPLAGIVQGCPAATVAP